VQRAGPGVAVALALLLVGVVSVATACSKGGPGNTSLLPPQDLQSNGAPFDADEILDSASMQDESALDAGGIEQFLQQTPYGAASFLSTYESHGIPASDAIASAAQQYSLNPIVFLVRAEMDQGLVASADYPSPTSRVDYAFGCGCTAPGTCDPDYAGFDVQVDCLGGALRDSLDAIAATGQTAGGWGPGIAGTTIDGLQVTPADDSTAALYQYTPVVDVGVAGGNWLFWNLWQQFASALDYTPPSQPTGPSAWIGDGCAGNGDCSYDGTAGTCATQFPGGLCTLSCTMSCPSSPSQSQTFCADFGTQGGFCLAVCNPADPQCRTGYACQSVAQFGDASRSESVCFPQ
jgi:hypothetical protein